MRKRLVLFNLIFFMGAIPPAWGLDAMMGHKPLLRDGFALNGIDGKLAGPDSNDVWFFELASDVNDYREQVNAGTKLELLPSSALEKMIADANGSSGASYRLWGRITKYKGRNFIFPNHFLPFGKTPPKEPQKPEINEPPAKDNELQPDINDPNSALAIPSEIMKRLEADDSKEPNQTKETVPQSTTDEPENVLEMPPEIMERLKASKTIRPERPNRRAAISKSGPAQDSILADRTAFLAKQDNGQPVFVLDALGLNVRPVSLLLLPCEALELTEQKQSAVPERLRFKIAGFITTYKGKNYLLLQKATRIYSHGNFGI
jgi:hypothetical protein